MTSNQKARMNYQGKGLASGGVSSVRVRKLTVRTILPKGRKVYSPLLDSWSMIAPTKAVVMPGKAVGPLTGISRKERISPLSRIAEQLPNKLVRVRR